jgi:hypothetical protein
MGLFKFRLTGDLQGVVKWNNRPVGSIVEAKGVMTFGLVLEINVPIGITHLRQGFLEDGVIVEGETLPPPPPAGIRMSSAPEIVFPEVASTT